MEASTYGPQKQAEAVMDALVAGDVDRVLELAPQQGIQGPLVTRAAYARARDRPSRYTVSDVRTQGSTAVVSVVASLGTRDVPMSLGLVRTGRHLGLVDTWRVTDLPLVDMTLAVPASATSVLVDGQQVPVQPVAGATGQRTVTLTALPATYTLSLAAVSRYLVAPTVQRQVVPNGQVGVVQLGYSAAPTLATAVDAQMRKAVAACAAQTDLAPAGCPWGLEAGPTQQVRAIHWQVLRQPSAIVQQTQDPGLWQLQTRSTGLARITFEAMDTATGTGTWTKGTQDVDFGANGTVRLDGDTLTVTFR